VEPETAADGASEALETAEEPETPEGCEAPEEPGLDRIWTIPNLLSVGRLLLLGLFAWLLFGEHEQVAATIVLMVTGTTDFLDGYVARRLHQVTTLGKVLDPTADRIVLVTGVIVIAAYGAVPWWLAGVVLGRELLVSVAVLALAAMGAPRIDVLWVGKAGTFGLMGCFPLFLLGDSTAGWARVLHDVTWVLLVPALAFSFTAAVAYIPLARRALAERRIPPTNTVSS
jgi:cardiolipin synthase